MKPAPKYRVFREVRTAILLMCVAVTLCVGQEAVSQLQTSAPSSRSSVHVFSLTKFYDTPDPLPPGKPGELIHSAAFDFYDLPRGMRAIRILYHTRSATGGDVASSGVVVLPDKTPPPGGWPVIAWAHDETGVARQCAPSLARSLQHGPFLAMYVNVGYAVVATDYTGLGTKFRHAFADAPSNAWNVIDAVPAARSAIGQLGSRWVAMGTGAGAMAAISVAELEHDIHDSNYLGSVAIPRLADLQDLFVPAGRAPFDLPFFLAYGVKTVYPQFEPGEILSEKGATFYQRIAQGCGTNGAEPKADSSGLLRAHWENNEFVEKYFNRNRLGQQPSSSSLLVIVSADDPATAGTNKIVERLCRQGSSVQFARYADSDPGRVIGDSVRDQMAWIQARFANRPIPSDCLGGN